MLISIKKIVNSKFQYLSIELITRYITNQIIEIISARKKSSKKQQNPNKLALFQLIPRLLKGSGSSVRNTGLSLCFDLLRDLFKDEEYEDLKYLLWKYEILNNYKSILEELTDCSFLYGLSDLYPSFFEFSYKNLNKFSFLIDILDGLEDVRFLIHQGIDPINNENLDQELQNSIINLFKTTILKPLTNDIEDFLRINVHSILIDKIKTPNILKTELKLVKESLNKGNINIFGYKVNIGNEIISKLNEVFYNINALNPFDYETYELIRQLAYEEFGLKMASVHIPSQTIEQGNVDLVNLMKNLSFFVNKYAYHLLENTFLEIPKKNEGKMLLSIGIQQIADSIKTHGLGIINTFVNENYKFLTK